MKKFDLSWNTTGELHYKEINVMRTIYGENDALVVSHLCQRHLRWKVEILKRWLFAFHQITR